MVSPKKTPQAGGAQTSHGWNSTLEREHSEIKTSDGVTRKTPLRKATGNHLNYSPKKWQYNKQKVEELPVGCHKPANRQSTKHTHTSELVIDHSNSIQFNSILLLCIKR